MALPAPNLDDRRFQDIVDEAKRLIPHYCPEWTNHNVSDPGVALIELFAWMTEMLLYRLNQVPDRLYLKFLELVGIELFAAQPAKADLTFWLSAPEAEPVLVPAETEVATAASDGGEPIVFTTESDLRIEQPELVAFLTSTGRDRYVDRWDDLGDGRVTVRCFPSRPVTPGDAFYLGFRQPLAGHLIRLDVDASVSGLGIDPERPPLAWETWAGTDWLPAKVHVDETGGLNRDGSITLLLPLQHEPLTLGRHRAHWLRGRLVEAAPGQPPYRKSPEIRTVSAVGLGGTVGARHGQPVPLEALGRSNGAAGQVFVCRHHPVLPRRDGETVRTVTSDGAWEWDEVEDFSRSGPDDRHVKWDGATGEVRFGPRIRYPDGTVRQQGAIPPDGAEVVVTGYRYGGGAAGNVGAGTLTVLRTTIPYVDRVKNLAPATGGVDAESIDNAKERGPLTLRHGDRAVTAEDFERLVLDADPIVARARCLPPKEAGGPVRLLVVPRTSTPVDRLTLDDLAISDELLAQLAAHLEPRRLVGTSVEIGEPLYRGVTVAALVAPRPGVPHDLVRQRALDALYRCLHPTLGGPAGDGWRFDTDVNEGALHRVLAGVEGVHRIDEILLFEADLRGGGRLGRACDSVRAGREGLPLSFNHRVVVRER